MNGWVKIHRKLAKWEWYTDVPVTKLFLHLLLTVNHEPSEWRGHTVLAGSGVYGRDKLAEQTGLTPSQVRTASKKLENSRQIAIKRNTKFSIISIVNWEDYQSDSRQIADKSPTTSPTNRHILRREENKKIGIEPSFEGIATPVPEIKLERKKATRLSPDWTLPDELKRWASAQGFSEKQIQTEAAKFKDHWISASGKSAAKLDWAATWRNWLRTDWAPKPEGSTVVSIGGVEKVTVKHGDPLFEHAAKFLDKQRNRTGHRYQPDLEFPKAWLPLVEKLKRDADEMAQWAGSAK